MDIRLLGEPAILGEGGERRLVRGHQSWALLARVLLSPAPPDRRSLAAELFPDTDDPLGALRWCLAALRKALDCSECFSGDPVKANLPDGVRVDVLQIDQDGFNIEATGQLLGEMHPKCSAEFSTWLLVERARISSLLEARLRQDALRAIAIGDFERAVRLSELCVRSNVFEERAHILLVKSMVLAGRPEAALRHVEAAESTFLIELGEYPSTALRSAARRTISSPPGGISTSAFVNSLLQSGLAALSAGAVDAGIDCLRRAAADAESLKDKLLQARTTFELGTALVHSIRGYDDEGAVLLRQSVEFAQCAGLPEIASSGYRELGYVEALAGRRPAAMKYLTSALEAATDDWSRAGTHSVIGFNLVDWGKSAEGLHHFETSLELARHSGNRRREMWSLGVGAWGLLSEDRLDEARAWLGASLALSDEHRWIAFRPWPIALLAETQIRQGKPEEPIRVQLEEAFAMSCQLGDPCWEAAVARAMALNFAALDELHQAVDWLNVALRSCIRHSDAFRGLQVAILADQVAINTKFGRRETADDLAREWLGLAAKTHARSHITRAMNYLN